MTDILKFRQSLENYKPSDENEAVDRLSMLKFLECGQDCFVRTNPWAHFTGSALLINKTGDKVLLNHHRFLNFWLQFGGHADGETDLFSVARREVAEESGFDDVTPVVDGIFDVSIHGVPFNPAKRESSHLHYDVRYFFRLNSDDESFKISDESHDLRWCTYDEAVALTGPGSIKRMLDKWKAVA